MKILYLFLFMLCSYSSFSQDFLLDKRSKIRKKMEQYLTENKLKYSFRETDSTVSYNVNDSFSLPMTNVFYFNEQNRCIKQENIFTCDSCMQLSMKQSLTHKFINWEKIGEQSYYAGFPYNALMEQVTGDGRFIVRFTRMKRKTAKKDS
ncbi:MAG TPA: hypothetical protein VHL77_07730 [Ferruginibacter sp.]|jgi:hypothetical protein|nr:hypothetical protein [Ferruginibacter sp.]